MAYTETSYQGWGSRLMDSIKGVLFGGILFLIAFPLLFKNEGCAVESYQTIAEAKEATHEGKSETIDPALDKKMVSMRGQAKTEEILDDKTFNVQANAISLSRTTEMYQWEEDEKTEKKRKLGGGEETVRTWTYRKTWSRSRISSSDFKEQEGHQNPSSDWPFGDFSETAKVVNFGAFVLSPSQISEIRNSETLPVTQETLEAVPQDVRSKHPNLQVYERGFYLGKDPGSPQIGDMKISFTVVKPTPISILAVQTGNTFEKFHAKTGRDFDWLAVGTETTEQMYKAAENQVAMITWFIRGGGFLLMFIGLKLIFAPLGVAGDVVPFIGTMFRFGTGIVAGVIAAFFSLATIAIAWFYYRPMFALILLGVGLGLVVLVFVLAKGKKPAQGAG